MFDRTYRRISHGTVPNARNWLTKLRWTSDGAYSALGSLHTLRTRKAELCLCYYVGCSAFEVSTTPRHDYIPNGPRRRAHWRRHESWKVGCDRHLSWFCVSRHAGIFIQGVYIPQVWLGRSLVRIPGQGKIACVNKVTDREWTNIHKPLSISGQKRAATSKSPWEETMKRPTAQATLKLHIVQICGLSCASSWTRVKKRTRGTGRYILEGRLISLQTVPTDWRLKGLRKSYIMHSGSEYGRIRRPTCARMKLISSKNPTRITISMTKERLARTSNG